jgi:hypothetical protein
MDGENTVGLRFRVSPRIKKMQEAAAAHERRSLTNTLEVLVEDYCLTNGHVVHLDAQNPSPV